MAKRTTRRQLLKTSSQAGLFSAFPAILTLSSPFTSAEDDAKASAQHVLRFASPYLTDSWRSTPHMHREFKKNVEAFSNGRIFVEILDGGQAGSGPTLMAKVARGFVDGALISASNLSPVAPQLDILNIPFWSAENQAYLNLVTSELWKKQILDRIEAAGLIKVLFGYVVDARTASTVRSYDKILKRPSDVKNIVFRVPSSEVLSVFYELLEARTFTVNWGDVAEKARNKDIHAFDSSLIGLYNGPDNLHKEVGSISLIKSVQDSWEAVVSQKWMNELSLDLRESLVAASNQTFMQQLRSVQEAESYCEAQFKKQRTIVYRPTLNERQEWIEQCGHQHPIWTPIKRKILGDDRQFEAFLEATQTNNGFTI